MRERERESESVSSRRFRCRCPPRPAPSMGKASKQAAKQQGGPRLPRSFPKRPAAPSPSVAKASKQHMGPAGFPAAGPTTPPGSGTLRMLEPTSVGAGTGATERQSAEVLAADIMDMLHRRSLVGVSE